LGQALERLLAAADGVADRALAVELGELADVGAGDEALVLGRTQDQGPGRIQGQPLEQRFEFDQHVLAEGVDRLAGAIERQHGNAVGALLDLPVAEAQSVQASNHAGPSVRVWVALYDPEGVAPQSNPAPARPGANRLRALCRLPGAPSSGDRGGTSGPGRGHRPRSPGRAGFCKGRSAGPDGRDRYPTTGPGAGQ